MPRMKRSNSDSVANTDACRYPVEWATNKMALPAHGYDSPQTRGQDPKDKNQQKTQGSGTRSGEARDPECTRNLPSILAGIEFPGRASGAVGR